MAIFGAVGSGKTSACMHPFARQLLSWQAKNPERRPAALILEVKGDFCHDIRTILKDAGREADYIELSLDGQITWNPLSATWLDFVLARLYRGVTSESAVRQGERTILATGVHESRPLDHRTVPRAAPPPRRQRHARMGGRFETCTTVRSTRISSPRNHRGADVRPRQVRRMDHHRPGDDARRDKDFRAWRHRVSTAPGTARPTPGAVQSGPSEAPSSEHDHVRPRAVRECQPRTEIRLRVEAVNRWYVHDWNTLDNKIRSSIVEGISVFLSMFDLPSVARVFLSARAPSRSRSYRTRPTRTKTQGGSSLTAGRRTDHLPPLDQLIDSGRVLALNMPAGTNPALARAVGVMLKNAWLQSLLRRPAAAKRDPGRYVRPAVFICDEYQAFASVGEDDPSGDEKAFALTRQCRVIPIVATQSISSLRSVLGSGEAWRTLLQNAPHPGYFLSLSDEASAELASKLCGQVAKIKSSYTINESAKSSGINLMSAQAGGGKGSVGASKSFREHREALFQPRDFALLGNCQAICLPYDGVQSLPPRRVYLKPYYLPPTSRTGPQNRQDSYEPTRRAGTC